MPPRCHPFVNLPFPKILSILKICSQDRTRIVCNLIRSRPWKECTFERETRQRMARNFNVGEEVWVEEEWGIITAEEKASRERFFRVLHCRRLVFYRAGCTKALSYERGRRQKYTEHFLPSFEPLLSSSTVAPFHFLHPVGPFFAGGGQTYSKPGCNLSEHSRDNFQPDEARCFNRDIPLRRMLR